MRIDNVDFYICSFCYSFHFGGCRIMNTKYIIPQGKQIKETIFLEDERSHHFHLVAVTKTKDKIKRVYKHRAYVNEILYAEVSSIPITIFEN